MQQSPIDIANPNQADLENISFDYGTTALNILNNGHTVQVNYDSGSSIMLDGKTYNLVQFHFHTPSEHTVNNQSYAMEVHFVHSDASGNLAVVGVLVTAGAENSAYAPILNNAPAEEAEEETIAGVTIDADDLLPTSKRYFTYGGSLTTPPCSEGVKWLVLVEPIEMSQAQIDALANILHNNNRPVQSLNGRTPQEDTTE
jgi:carbonic anhydrase